MIPKNELLKFINAWGAAQKCQEPTLIAMSATALNAAIKSLYAVPEEESLVTESSELEIKSDEP
jgi:hypothetical protein